VAVAEAASPSAARFGAQGVAAPASQSIDARCRKALREVGIVMGCLVSVVA